jgi:hypothetical protein
VDAWLVVQVMVAELDMIPVAATDEITFGEELTGALADEL